LRWVKATPPRQWVNRLMDRSTPAVPLVYSCSGCSSAAQLSNHLAVRLDRAGLAEMSCIAGVGGQVPSLVRKVGEAAASARDHHSRRHAEDRALQSRRRLRELQGLLERRCEPA
jgi:hypothetical protein